MSTDDLDPVIHAAARLRIFTTPSKFDSMKD